jgi:iron(III) transport system substrate-binding protein
MRVRRPACWLALVAAGCLLAGACAPGARPASPSDAPATSSPAAPAAAPAGAGGADAPAAPADPFAVAKSLSLDELHQRALAESGTLVLYATLAQNNPVVPGFERRFPGLKVDHTDATVDKLVSRLVAEARGGKVLADVVAGSVDHLAQVNQQGLALQDVPPEAETYPADYRGRYWVATFVLFTVPAWNTNLTRPDEAPRTFDDFGDPRWKGRLIADARDADIFMALATRKYGNDDAATDVLRRIAANEPEFHRGHSELAELLVAGHAAGCPTCSAHHFPTRMRRGAPVDYSLAEGVASISGSTILKDAPHPYTAMLWMRWAHGEEGQQLFAESGRVPAHPRVPPTDRLLPERVYAVGPDEYANLPRYERIWKDVLDVR